jgi:hypothetical protein
MDQERTLSSSCSPARRRRDNNKSLRRSWCDCVAYKYTLRTGILQQADLLIPTQRVSLKEQNGSAKGKATKVVNACQAVFRYDESALLASLGVYDDCNNTICCSVVCLHSMATIVLTCARCELFPISRHSICRLDIAPKEEEQVEEEAKDLGCGGSCST